MKFDDILREIGDFGPYQRRIYALVCFLIMPSSWVTLLHVFATTPTDHWCKVPNWNMSGCEGSFSARCDITIKKLSSIPLVDIGNRSDASDVYEFQKCSRYNGTDFSFLTNELNKLAMNGTNYDDVMYYHLSSNQSRDIIPCDVGWEYDTSEFTRNVVQENDLVCGRETFVQYAQSVYYLGYLFGSVIFGTLADRHGRYPVLLFVVLLNVVSGYAHLLFRSYWAYIIIRFFQGLGNIAKFVIAYVVGTEFVGTSRRNISGMLSWIPSAIGHMMLAGIAYLVRDWRMFIVAVITPQLLLFLCMICLPESPRWLISQGKTEKAKKIIRKAAKVNGVTLREDVLGDCGLLAEKAESDRTQIKYTPIELFRHRNISRRTLILMYVWAVCSASYHGFNLSTSSLGVNRFISFMVAGAVEILAVLFCIFLVEMPWFGRRRSLVISLVLSGTACLMTIFINPGPWRATVGMVGKFATSSAFVIVYLLTVELNPTPIRNIAMGFCSMTSRIGGILAPLTLLTSQYWEPAPLVIFGSILVVGGLAGIFLPETIGRKLPETIEDGENYGKMELEENSDTKQPVGEDPSIHDNQSYGEEKV